MNSFLNSPSPAPKIIAETPLYLVVYKPPGIHTAPLAGKAGETLLSWAAARYPDVLSPRGSLDREGGLLHRLDYETRGLVLIARTQAALDALLWQQKEDRIIKEYTALSAGRKEDLPGFPPFPGGGPSSAEAGTGGPRGLIESAFRPYGKGRKAVRPVLPAPGQTLYRTEILSWTADNPVPPRAPGLPGASSGPARMFRLRISRGYRHQIRSHLAWAGWPIVNDALYGGVENAVENAVPGLALCAGAVSFIDPETGRPLRYRLDDLS
ncbi:MAG: RNA pseudouridine synthase [Spirochaetaceae bacterium]|jgi:23S rRNA pseudouridine1911/1915/1917 synthase|nr:RNA pseudouridine synthase [Spirochaetaceae bacterium]